MPTHSEACDELTKIVNDAWTGVPAIVGAFAPLMIESRDGNDEPKPRPKGWGRFTIRHGEADSEAFGKKYRNYGSLFVNIMILPTPGATEKLKPISALINAALRAHRGDVLLTRVRTQEAGIQGGWAQYNVLADFNYFQRNT